MLNAQVVRLFPRNSFKVLNFFAMRSRSMSIKLVAAAAAVIRRIMLNALAVRLFPRNTFKVLNFFAMRNRSMSIKLVLVAAAAAVMLLPPLNHVNHAQTTVNHAQIVHGKKTSQVTIFLADPQLGVVGA